MFTSVTSVEFSAAGDVNARLSSKAVQPGKAAQSTVVRPVRVEGGGDILVHSRTGKGQILY